VAIIAFILYENLHLDKMQYTATNNEHSPQLHYKVLALKVCAVVICALYQNCNKTTNFEQVIYLVFSIYESILN